MRALAMLAVAAAATLAAFGGPAHAAPAHAAPAPRAHGPATAAAARAARAAQAAASTPPMGYSTWYQYWTTADEAVVLAQARELVSTGLAAAGYDYVNLDDGWMAARRTRAGTLTWNRRLFPHGLPWLAAQLHSMGLKFGIYEAIGNQTCQHFPGSWAHYWRDAVTFAHWGVDFVKVDECGGLPKWMTSAKLAREFQQFGTDLRKANPDVVYSQELPIYTLPRVSGMLTAPFLNAVRWSSRSANMWRVTPDENPSVPAKYTVFSHLATDLHLHLFAGPGHWNDLDMLIPGVPKFHWDYVQQRNQLSIWAQEASPLIISTNIAALTASEISALENPVMINIDRSGQARTSFKRGGVDVVVKDYLGGGKSVLLANGGKRTETGRIPLSRLGVHVHGAASEYNVWNGTTQAANGISYRLAPSHTMLLVVGPSAPAG